MIIVFLRGRVSLYITLSRETRVHDKSCADHQDVFSCLRCDVFLQDDEDQIFLAIGRAMEEIVDDAVDCYWLVRCFINQFKLKFGDSVPHLVQEL